MPATLFGTRCIAVTGTDTGVGKTILTALLLRHLRAGGAKALAMKPFCSGGRDDAELLCELQDDEAPLDLANPFYFEQPVAPLVAARASGRKVQLGEVLQAVGEMARRCDILLIEGAGGLLAPLGEGFALLDFIKALNCEVIIAAADRLGTINHTLLTRQALGRSWKVKIVLIATGQSDSSALTNGALLRELLPNTSVVQVPWLGPDIQRAQAIHVAEKKLKKTLATIVAET